MGFAYVVSSASGLELLTVCDDLSKLVQLAESAKPDIVLLDLTSELTFGVLSDLQRSLPDSKTVLWVRSISTEMAYQAMALGVRGILRKTLPVELLIKCLQKVHEGEFWFEKTLTASFLAAKTIGLTKRESQLVSLLSQGLKNKEIAATLSITEGTVKVYLSRLFQKVGVKDRFELALYGLKNMTNITAGQPVFDGLPRARAAGRGAVQMQWPRSLILDKSPARTTDQLHLWDSEI